MNLNPSNNVNDAAQTAHTETTPVSTQSSAPKWIAGILAAGLVAALGFNYTQFQNSAAAETATARKFTELSAELKSTQTRLNESGAAFQQSIAKLDGSVVEARKQAAYGVAQAKAMAEARVKSVEESVEKKLVAQLDQKDAEIKKQLDTEIAQVKDAADKSATEISGKITGVSTEVAAVRTDAQATRTELDKTVAALMRTTGDLGLVSGLVATNGKEIAALRELGERNYFEFTLAKMNQPQKIGGVAIVVKKVDTKRNRYTIEVVADDKRVEKKDKGVNEPLQFYVASKARQPYELVVNEVKKDQIIGYLSVPKVSVARN